MPARWRSRPRAMPPEGRWTPDSLDEHRASRRLTEIQTQRPHQAADPGPGAPRLGTGPVLGTAVQCVLPACEAGGRRRFRAPDEAGRSRFLSRRPGLSGAGCRLRSAGAGRTARGVLRGRGCTYASPPCSHSIPSPATLEASGWRPRKVLGKKGSQGLPENISELKLPRFQVLWGPGVGL